MFILSDCFLSVIFITLINFCGVCWLMFLLICSSTKKEEIHMREKKTTEQRTNLISGGRRRRRRSHAPSWAPSHQQEVAAGVGCRLVLEGDEELKVCVEMLKSLNVSSVKTQQRENRTISWTTPCSGEDSRPASGLTCETGRHQHGQIFSHGSRWKCRAR